MTGFPASFDEITERFRSLPGVGKKSAVRMAFGIAGMSVEEAEEFGRSIADARRRIKKCSVCGNLSESDVCSICSDPGRDDEIICVVEDTRGLIAMEKAENFNGKYHVLGGTVSPLDGRGPEDINLFSLVDRVKDGKVKEVIVATGSTVDGESTALYVANLIKPYGVVVTRIGRGIPAGGDLDFADEITITHAIEGRREL